MNIEKLKLALEGEPGFREKQCLKLVYADFISLWTEATVLPKGLVAKLEEEVPLASEVEFFESEDGRSVKALITLEDGAVVEAVLMRHKDGRNTVCVSSQVGCAMGCKFCATGKLGLKRNLEVGEILEQVLVFERYLREIEGGRVRNVVFMGMGEPMANFENVWEAVLFLNNEKYFNIGARRISISTCGIVPGILRLAEKDMQVNLAVSLHAANEDLRSKIMPVNASYGVDAVLDAVTKYIEKTGRKVMIEYVLLKGVNDSLGCARELAGVLKKRLGRLFMVNLILYNDTGDFFASEREVVANFKDVLEKEKISVVQRFRFGGDVEGACGQLAGER